ncbi:hypothetical protein Tco_0616384 [Tanacetum coccineum]
MRGNIQNKVDKETRFMNKFDQFVAEPGEALVFVYNRFAQLMNYLERNNMNFPTMTINIKFLNSLQPEWLKYVTQVRHAKQLTVHSFDDLFDYLQQFEKLVNASRAKKLEKSHDPLALVAHTGDRVVDKFKLEFWQSLEEIEESAILYRYNATTAVKREHYYGNYPKQGRINGWKKLKKTQVQEHMHNGRIQPVLLLLMMGQAMSLTSYIGYIFIIRWNNETMEMLIVAVVK